MESNFSFSCSFHLCNIPHNTSLAFYIVFSFYFIIFTLGRLQFTQNTKHWGTEYGQKSFIEKRSSFLVPYFLLHNLQNLSF